MKFHIIDINKKLLFTTLDDNQTYVPPVDKALNLVIR
jgi:two-component system nitrogen regulation sensor histidine kinase NtrY